MEATEGGVVSPSRKNRQKRVIKNRMNHKNTMNYAANISFEGVNSEALMLAMKGICSFSNGSACTAKDYAYSYVLDVMGLPEPQLESAVRLSWDIEDISEGVRDLIQVVSMLQGAD